MKKLCVLMLASGITLGVHADEQGFMPSSSEEQSYMNGGFRGPTPAVTSVARAKTLPDDAWVVLEGNIVRQIGHERYEFRDSTGLINVDIDDKRWMGKSASPETYLRLEGEIERDWNSLEVDVKTIKILR